MNYLQNAGAFLITTIFGFVIGLFLIRLLLIGAGAPFNNPICRFVYSATNSIATPLRRFVPRWGRIEFASLLIAWLLALVEFGLLMLISGTALSLPGVMLRALVQILGWLIWIELIAILVRCVLSFIVTARYDPNVQLLIQCTEPVVRPFRRLLPALGGLDFSCWFASIALILVQMLVLAPLADLALQLN